MKRIQIEKGGGGRSRDCLDGQCGSVTREDNRALYCSRIELNQKQGYTDRSGMEKDKQGET
jgi:hypothetical protein